MKDLPPVDIDHPDTLVLGEFLRDVTMLNSGQRNFRIFGPDETLSNMLGAVFEVTSRQWDARVQQNDEFLGERGSRGHLHELQRLRRSASARAGQDRPGCRGRMWACHPA